MKQLVSVLIALIGMGTVASTATAKSLDGPERAQAAGEGFVGSLAPKMVLKTIDGKQIDLGSFYGKKAVYLKFWATWCEACRAQMPHFEHIYQTANPDLAVIAIDVGFNDTLEDVQMLRTKLGLTMPIVFDDGRLGEAFHLRVTPQHVVIGKNGRIQYVGWRADQRLEDALTAARTSDDSNALPRADAGAAQARYYAVGDRLPKMSVRTAEGESFSLRDPKLKGPTVLVFLLSWCEGGEMESQRPKIGERCRQVREQVNVLSKQNTHVRWLGIASGIWTTEDDLVERDRSTPGIPLTLDQTGAWFRSFRVVNTPTFFLADRDGKIVRRIDGFDTTLPELLSSLEK
jgi:thiol-disulfide isomerase/thioredoxin